MLPNGSREFFINAVSQQMEFNSRLLTKSEKEQFIKDSYTVSRYPKAYKDNPKAFRERLRKNNAIINDRELEKSFKGGDFWQAECGMGRDETS